MKEQVVFLDTVHPVLFERLVASGMSCRWENKLSRNAILDGALSNVQGIVLRSRLTLDLPLLQAMPELKWIARSGAGLENIDTAAAADSGIQVINSPEGNAASVGEHVIGQLLMLLHKLHQADRHVRIGGWDREAHRGSELGHQTIGIIGYGNTGKSFAKRIFGFDVKTLCYDILDNVGDQYAKQVDWKTLQAECEIISLHIPQTPLTRGMIDKKFIADMGHPFWLLNTARGSAVITEDLVAGLQSQKIIGAGLDVLEYETRSFSSIFNGDGLPSALQYLTEADHVLLSPHVAGWTRESHVKLATTIVEKVKKLFF